MSLWFSLSSRFRALFRRRSFEADMAAEMADHIERTTAVNIAAGMAPDEACFAARRQFGGVDQIKEAAREQRSWLWLEQFLRDIRIAGRRLAKSRGFTCIAMLIIAIGIGATTTIFSVVNAIVLRAIPLPGSDRLAVAYETNLSRNVPMFSVSHPNFADWRERAQSWESLAAMRWRWMNFSGVGDTELVVVRPMPPTLFPTLGITPVLGRGFLDEEGPAQSKVAIVSHAFWQSRLGGVPDVLNRSIRLDGKSYSIVGVLAPNAFFPDDLDVAIPIPVSPPKDNRGDHDLDVYGRLKPGVTFEQADAELKAIAAQIERDHPEVDRGWSTQLQPLSHIIVGSKMRTGLFVLLGAVGVLLSIACANFSNLLLIRTSARTHEIAVCTALGAGRERLIRQLITESLTITALGGVFGVLLSLGAIALLRKSDLPRAPEISVDLRVLAVACGVTFLVGCFAGIGPALRASQTQPQDALKGGTLRVGSALRSRFRDAMIITQIALSLMLVIAATILIRSFSRLNDVNPGFTSEPVLTAGLRPADGRQAVSFYEHVTARVAALPEVVSVGLVSSLPLTNGNASNTFYSVGRSALPSDGSLQASWRLVDGGYFDTLQIPLIRGKTFAGLSRNEAANSAILSAAMARTLFGDEDPVGRQVANGSPNGERLTVIGVVGDVRSARLGVAPAPTLYWSMHRFIYGPMRMVVRARGEMEPLTKAIRAIVKETDPGVPVFKFRTMREIRAQSLSDERLTASLLGGFAVAALLLAALGTYGVISFTVQERTREIGIRIAIGAQAGDVCRLVLMHGFRVVGLGVIFGLCAALISSRGLAAMLFETQPADAVSFLVATAALSLAALCACVLPMVRAVRTDPVIALRAS